GTPIRSCVPGKPPWPRPPQAIPEAPWPRPWPCLRPCANGRTISSDDDPPMTLFRLLLPLFLTILAGCAGTPRQSQVQAVGTAKQPYVAKDTSRTVDLTSPPTDAWDRIRRGFAIPNLNTDLAQEWTDYYAAHPESVQRMAERAGKYLYFIVDEINRRGLPTELALLPFVESAYNPTALSRSQASGLWQFVPSTGTYFNLKQDWWRDERRDPIAST